MVAHDSRVVTLLQVVHFMSVIIPIPYVGFVYLRSAGRKAPPTKNRLRAIRESQGLL